MSLTAEQRQFIETHPTSAMVTVGGDGWPKAVRMAVAFVDERLLSSGTQDRVRTARLRDDPRCTVFVFEDGFRWLTLETRVSMIEGEQAIDLTVELFRTMQGRPTGPLSWFGGELDEAAFRERMVEEGRLLYEFEVGRVYGMA